MGLWSWSPVEWVVSSGPQSDQWLKDDCALTAVWPWPSDSDSDLTWVARNVRSSNSEHSFFFPSCFLLPLTLALFLIICLSLVSFSPYLILFSFLFFFFFFLWLCNVGAKYQANPWECNFFLLQVRGSWRPLFCCDSHVNSAQRIQGSY